MFTFTGPYNVDFWHNKNPTNVKNKYPEAMDWVNMEVKNRARFSMNVDKCCLYFFRKNAFVQGF